MPTATPARSHMSSSPSAPPVRPAGPGGAPVTPLSMNPIDPMRIIRMYYMWFIGSGIVGVMLGIVVFIVLRQTMPRYTAVLQFDVKPVESSTETLGIATGVGGLDEMEKYMGTQALVLGDDRILTKALERSDIQETKWGKQFNTSGGFNVPDALDAMRGIVSARAMPDTTFIQLRVTTPDKNDAATIANTIGSVFQRESSSSVTGPMNAAMADYEERLRNLEADLAALDASMESLLNDRDITGLEQQQQVYYVEVQNVQPTLVATRELLAQTQSRLEQFEDLMNSDVGGEGIIFPEQVRQDAESRPIVQQLKSQITNTKAALRSAREQYGRNHMTVKRLERTLRSYEQELATTTEQEMAQLFQTTLEQLQNAVRSYQASESEFIERLTKAQTRLNEITQTLKTHADLQDKRDTKLKQLAEVETEMARLNQKRNKGGRVVRVAPAVPPDRVSFPQLVPTVGLVTFLCVSCVGGLIVLRELREQRIRGPQDVSRIPRTRFLGFVPDVSMDLTKPERIESACIEQPEGAIAESYRQIRVNILKTCDRHGHKAILFAAGMPGSGNSTVVMNFAAMAAAVDRKVLVVDANFRRPAIGALMGKEGSPGLSDVLAGDISIQDAVLSAECHENLHILSAGNCTKGSYEHFTTQRMSDLIDSVRQEYDLIVFDVSPAVVSGDALALAAQCDATVLVVRAFGEKRGLVARLRNQFNDIDAEFLGVIVNAVKHTAGGYFKSNVRATAEYVQSPPEDEEADTAAKASEDAAPDADSSQTK